MKTSVTKELLKNAPDVEDRHNIKGVKNDGYFYQRNARGKRWTWEKTQLKNANRKIRHNKNIDYDE